MSKRSGAPMSQDQIGISGFLKKPEGFQISRSSSTELPSNVPCLVVNDPTQLDLNWTEPVIDLGEYDDWSQSSLNSPDQNRYQESNEIPQDLESIKLAHRLLELELKQLKQLLEEKHRLVGQAQNQKEKTIRKVVDQHQEKLKRQRSLFVQKEKQMKKKVDMLSKSNYRQENWIQELEHTIDYHHDKTQHKIRRIPFSPLSKRQQPETKAYSWSDKTLLLLETDTGLFKIVGNTFMFSQVDNREIRFRLKKVDYNCGYIGVDVISKEGREISDSQLCSYDLDQYLDEDQVGVIKENSYYTLTLHMKRTEEDSLFISWYVNEKMVKFEEYSESSKTFRIYCQIQNDEKKRTAIIVI